MEAEQVINYERELHEEQETVRNKILESMKDIQDGKGRGRICVAYRLYCI